MYHIIKRSKIQKSLKKDKRAYEVPATHGMRKRWNKIMSEQKINQDSHANLIRKERLFGHKIGVTTLDNSYFFSEIEESVSQYLLAMPDGGTLTVKLRSNDDFIEIDFIDTGNGISEEPIEKIFEPLFTTKQKGTGLGLASCKNIVEQHKGKISVKNNPTTFSIQLPKAPHSFSETDNDY